DAYPVLVQDIRQFPSPPHIDREGFELWHAPSAVGDFLDDEEVYAPPTTPSSRRSRWPRPARRARTSSTTWCAVARRGAPPWVSAAAPGVAPPPRTAASTTTTPRPPGSAGSRWSSPIRMRCSRFGATRSSTSRSEEHT